MVYIQARGRVLPIGHSPDCDFIAELEGRLLRVQVKCVQVKSCTGVLQPPMARDRLYSGGNQSWSGLVKRFNPTSCEYLFAVALGGPKYASFEVEPGRPLPTRTPEETPSTIAS